MTLTGLTVRTATLYWGMKMYTKEDICKQKAVVDALEEWLLEEKTELHIMKQFGEQETEWDNKNTEHETEYYEYVDNAFDELADEYYKYVLENSPEDIPLDDDTEKLFMTEEFITFCKEKYRDYAKNKEKN